MFDEQIFKPWAVGDDWGVEIIKGFYEGVTIQITDLKMSEEDGGIVLDFHTINKPDHINEDFSNDTQFEVVMSDIINDILKSAIDNMSEDESRKDDPTESSL